MPIILSEEQPNFKETINITVPKENVSQLISAKGL